MGSLAWSSVCKVGLSGAYASAVLSLGCMGTVVRECVVELGLYSHWGGLDRCSMSGRRQVVRISVHIQEIKAMIFNLYRMAAKIRLELRLEKTRRTARRSYLLRPEAGKHRHVSQQSGICCGVTYA